MSYTSSSSFFNYLIIVRDCLRQYKKPSYCRRQTPSRQLATPSVTVMKSVRFNTDYCVLCLAISVVHNLWYLNITRKRICALLEKGKVNIVRTAIWYHYQNGLSVLQCHSTANYRGITIPVMLPCSFNHSNFDKVTLTNTSCICQH